MKYFAIALLAVFLIGTMVNAETLNCRTVAAESIYYSEGVIQLTAEIVSDSVLKNAELRVLQTNLGSHTPGQIRSHVEGAYKKFDLESDTWCNYQISLSNRFRARGPKRLPLWLDAFCEANTHSKHRLICVRVD